ncbi:MAG: carotenoid 1,2-hydratase [Bdellovibrionales bacterium]|nr:carotenoid 1,2-hydratase [Ramlibacter sp.]
MTPAFDLRVPPAGYAWWYLDALSDDGRHGLTLIAFIGSVFSPYYASARRRGQGLADPENHCAMNVALYAGPGSGAPKAWCMTERGRRAVERTASTLQIGPSGLTWDSSTLTAQIHETSVPWGRRMRGTVRLHPHALLGSPYPLDDAARHRWCPIAPSARVEVEMESPGLNWSGTAYLDCNHGDRPLEQDFQRWDWSRTALSGQRSAVLYDVTRRDGSAMSLALAFDGQGGATRFTPPPACTLAPTAWRVPRATRSDASQPVQVAQTLEDSPFYARSILQTHLLGEPATAVHESLCLQRWARPVVQLMLPFRMPRRG